MVGIILQQPKLPEPKLQEIVWTYWYKKWISQRILNIQVSADSTVIKNTKCKLRIFP